MSNPKLEKKLPSCFHKLSKFFKIFCISMQLTFYKPHSLVGTERKFEVQTNCVIESIFQEKAASAVILSYGIKQVEKCDAIVLIN